MNRTSLRAEQLFQQSNQGVASWTDRMFACLIVFQWLAGIGVASWYTPYTWSGSESSIHPNVWMACMGGASLISLPLFLIAHSPGKLSTRLVVAIAQMLQSAFFIHLLGGRLEAHFHIFGSLAFLSCYRDWRVLILASLVVAAEHFVRGMLWPESVYGIAAGAEWRWLEHTGWVGFLDVFLIYSSWKSRNEMWAIAERQAMMEDANDFIEQKVLDRTSRLLCTEEALRATNQRFELAIRGSQDGIWDWNITTGEVFFSPRFIQLLDYAEHEFPAHFHSFENNLHPEDYDVAMNVINNHHGVGEKAYNIVHRMRTKSGEWRWFRSRGMVTGDDQGNACRVTGSISDITKLRMIEQELLTAARLDKLTGLPNRVLLLDRLQQALNRSKRSPSRHFAVMFIDFDRFKIINDSLGHNVGDMLLKEIADRIRQYVRTTDSVCFAMDGNTVARLGGDEFVLLVDELSQPEDVLTIADRLLAAFAMPFQLGAHEVISTASIGIVLNNPEYELAEEILRDADTAMYEAKRAGKARYIVFDASMRRKMQRRLKLENDLRKAISTEQMVLVYQPIICLETGNLSGVEALLRWQHPHEGMISPVEFIPIAEDTDLILPLGERVLREGCAQLADWRRKLGTAAPQTMSINVSRKQFILPTLAKTIQTIIEEAGLPPASVQLEITESACMHDLPSAILATNAIKKIGVKLAIDDFGTGYSSLASLHQFPIDVLKIDRSFVNLINDDRETAVLVDTLTSLARNLGITTVAEGVETIEQLAALNEFGCDYGQGYFWAKPMTPSDIERFIASKTPDAIVPRYAPLAAANETQDLGLVATAHEVSN